jgi:hypothetical protein
MRWRYYLVFSYNYLKRFPIFLKELLCWGLSQFIFIDEVKSKEELLCNIPATNCLCWIQLCGFLLACASVYCWNLNCFVSGMLCSNCRISVTNSHQKSNWITFVFCPIDFWVVITRLQRAADHRIPSTATYLHTSSPPVEHPYGPKIALAFGPASYGLTRQESPMWESAPPRFHGAAGLFAAVCVQRCVRAF